MLTSVSSGASLAETSAAAAAPLPSGIDRARDAERLFTLAPDLLVVATPDGFFKRASPAFERVLGFTAAEMTDRPFLDWVHPEDVEATKIVMGGLLTGRSITSTDSFANRYRCKDGSYKWLSWAAAAQDAETGFIYAVARDVTEQRGAFRRLAAQNAVARVLSESPTLTDAARAVVAELARELECHRVIWWAKDEGAEQPTPTAVWLRDQSKGASSPSDVVLAAFASGAVSNASCDEWSTTAFPISSASRTLGVIEVTGQDRHLLGPGLAQVAEALGSQIGGFVERMQTKLLLDASEARSRTVDRATNDAVYELDLATNRLTWNAGVQRLFGYRPEDVVPTLAWWTERLHPDDLKRVDEDLERAIAAGASQWTSEYRYRRADGVYAWVLDRAFILSDDTKRADRMIGSMMDITARKRAEQDLVLLLELTRAVSAATDVDTASELVIRKLCETEAWAYGEIWFPAVDRRTLARHPAFYARTPQVAGFRAALDEAVLAADVKCVARVRDTRQTEWIEDVVGDPHGRFTRVEAAAAAGLRSAVAVPIVDDDEVLAVLVLLDCDRRTASDHQTGLLKAVAAQLGSLVRRKQAEQAVRVSEARYQIVTKATNDAVYDWDLENHTVTWGDGLRAFGYDPTTSGPSVLWWRERLHPEDADGVDREVCDAICRGDGAWHGEYRFRRADGGYAWVLDRSYVVLDKSGKASRLIGSLMDISERKRAAEALTAAKEIAEAAARARSQFLANMSHEIRTPMTAVLGFADLLLDNGLSPSTRLNYLLTIRRNGEHLLALLNDVLDFSKIEAGKMTFERIPCSPPQLLAEISSLMRVRALEKGLLFDLQYQTPIPTQVKSDPTRLRQILLNLVSNAIKFTETGRVSLIATCEDPNGEGATLVIAVRDTGIGMSDMERRHLFKAFEQADPSTTRRFGGSGLGLGISARLAAALGGEVVVDSAPGVGSTFALRLRIDPVGNIAMATTPLETPTVLAERETRAGSEAMVGNVLVAEDGADNQLLVTSILRARGLHVEVANNGRIAVARAMEAWEAERPYDLILMDMQMPELDGYGATATLRAKGYRRPIVALTAHAMAGERERCVAAGCDDYLTKPINRAALLDTIVRVLRRRRAPSSLTPSLDEPAGGAIVSAFANDPEMAEIVGVFATRLPERAGALRSALAIDDVSTFRRLLHQLEGAAGGYGFPSLTAGAVRVRAALDRSARPEEVRSALESLLTLCSRVRTTPQAA